MKISIIVPTYKSETTIGPCLASIKRQTLVDFECIVVDYPIDDLTKKTILPFIKNDYRFKYIVSPKKGAMSQREYAIKHSSGDYIGFVDSDDVIPNHYFENLYTALTRSNADFSCTFTKKMTLESITPDDLALNVPITCFRFMKKTNKSVFRDVIRSVSMCTKLFKRDMAIEACRYYNSNNELHLWEDAIFTFYIYMKSNSFAITYQPMYFYISNPQSVTKTSNYNYPYLLNNIKVTLLLFKICDDINNNYKKQCSIYLLFGAINYLLHTKKPIFKEFKKVRKTITNSLSFKQVKINHKEFSFSEKLISFSLKYNCFFILKITRKRLIKHKTLL